MRLSGEVYGAKCTRFGESGYRSSTALTVSLREMAEKAAAERDESV
jgi:hypothetical protein